MKNEIESEFLIISRSSVKGLITDRAGKITHSVRLYLGEKYKIVDWYVFNDEDISLRRYNGMKMPIIYIHVEYPTWIDSKAYRCKILPETYKISNRYPSNEKFMTPENFQKRVDNIKKRQWMNQKIFLSKFNIEIGKINYKDLFLSYFANTYD